MFFRTPSSGGPGVYKPDNGKMQYDGRTSNQSVVTITDFEEIVSQRGRITGQTKRGLERFS